MEYSEGVWIRMGNIEECKGKIFDKIKHIDEFENEYGKARELIYCLNVLNQGLQIKSLLIINFHDKWCYYKKYNMQEFF